jgi:hypothetical protein
MTESKSYFEIDSFYIEFERNFNLKANYSPCRFRHFGLGRIYLCFR